MNLAKLAADLKRLNAQFRPGTIKIVEPSARLQKHLFTVEVKLCTLRRPRGKWHPLMMPDGRWAFADSVERDNILKRLTQ